LNALDQGDTVDIREILAEDCGEAVGDSSRELTREGKDSKPG
jgi:hypothetical protein